MEFYMQSCSLDTILKRQELTNLIFHPSQKWTKISQNRHLYIEHVLPDSYLTAYKTEIDAFLALQDLPATQIETRHLENDTIPRTYLVLRVETYQWLQTIAPIQQQGKFLQSYTTQMNEARGPFQSPPVARTKAPLN